MTGRKKEDKRTFYLHNKASQLIEVCSVVLLLLFPICAGEFQNVKENFYIFLNKRVGVTPRWHLHAAFAAVRQTTPHFGIFIKKFAFHIL